MPSASVTGTAIGPAGLDKCRGLGQLPASLQLAGRSLLDRRQRHRTVRLLRTFFLGVRLCRFFVGGKVNNSARMQHA